MTDIPDLCLRSFDLYNRVGWSPGGPIRTVPTGFHRHRAGLRVSIHTPSAALVFVLGRSWDRDEVKSQRCLDPAVLKATQNLTQHDLKRGNAARAQDQFFRSKIRIARFAPEFVQIRPFRLKTCCENPDPGAPTGAFLIRTFAPSPQMDVGTEPESLAGTIFSARLRHRQRSVSA